MLVLSWSRCCRGLITKWQVSGQDGNPSVGELWVLYGECKNCALNCREATYQIHMEVRDREMKPSTGDMPGVLKGMGRCRGGGHDQRVGVDGDI